MGMQQEQALQRVRGIASIVLDTTYCSPQYLFPPQLQVRSPLLWPLLQFLSVPIIAAESAR